jgi:hypothetical protein
MVASLPGGLFSKRLLDCNNLSSAFFLAKRTGELTEKAWRQE